MSLRRVDRVPSCNRLFNFSANICSFELAGRVAVVSSSASENGIWLRVYTPMSSFVETTTPNESKIFRAKSR